MSNVHIGLHCFGYGLVNAGGFFWRTWIDAVLADPARFDYNDAFSEIEAASSTRNSRSCPVGRLSQMDSTCWTACQLIPAGYEVGACYRRPPTPAPQPRMAACGCGIRCWDRSKRCCEKCNDGCYWEEDEDFCHMPF